ncbi:ricin-type beta-trefoil lectin domain protein [Streptomyces sp. Agncl-13]|uniref:ricin-type beta-trefoil lectin domain protein n=1 Tax=Streptomyces sp. Agncl-13 TaxID=3400628 RepID=UPI003A89BD0F
MTASSEDPTAEADPTPEAATARAEQRDAASLSLPRRQRGPSVIAAAAAALGPAADSESGAVPDPGSVSPPPLSAAAAEFAALTEGAPDTAAPGVRTGVRARVMADHRADGTAVPGRSAPHPARRRKVLLAAAAVTAGVLLIGSLFLMGGGSEGSSEVAGTGSDAALDGGGNQDASGSASPSGESSALDADATRHPDGRPTSDAASPGSGKNTVGSTATSNGETKNGLASPGSSPGDSSPAAESADAAKGVLIRGRASSRCVDVTGGSSADHTRLQIWDCTGAARQRWQFASDGTVRALGKCMDVDGGSRQDGAWIKIVECNGTGAQRFQLNAANDLVNIQADKCVDVTDQGTGNGAELQLWTCTGAGNQKWSTG